MQPIFKRTSQAVHFAYTIEAYPVGPKSTLEAITRGVLLEMGHPPRRSGIDFGNMNPLELRYECMKIRKSVHLYLATIEGKALEARFSTLPNARNRAIGSMADYLVTMIDLDPEVIELMTHRHYTAEDQRTEAMSVRSIGARYNLSKDRIARVAKRMEAYIQQIEAQAFNNLQSIFEKTEWVAPAQEAVPA